VGGGGDAGADITGAAAESESALNVSVADDPQGGTQHDDAEKKKAGDGSPNLGSDSPTYAPGSPGAGSPTYAPGSPGADSPTYAPGSP
jgi:hypothetical protein